VSVDIACAVKNKTSKDQSTAQAFLKERKTKMAKLKKYGEYHFYFGPYF
jgi:hypothetical protein